mmetsp:Transcript_19425/g.26702  ORF Transcript_19425/g.26702 Transcript_19425/m.26702 type:complete len:621 (-) Transcript_19425:335-2197(-)|eukprot:CAMPEP_0170068000 /NCGR_PEP_ID=MMETSP0019_2-20121128/7125_1 /TAXON_ID=98059 /ORGANISM="Dinobryon sp., Strain UTEXLB2267" /LENGTH=620 /DNA_ID=CAMNT_0010275507 /DNA_START=635 /DNA_END=2497 /DNA_ORIENTATION=+
MPHHQNSNNNNGKNNATSKSSQNNLSSSTSEVIVPKLTFSPSSNYHKWRKQILKQIKKDFGPIHDSIVSEQYPNFAHESMQLILTPPEDIFKEMTASVQSKSNRRSSISKPGGLGFLSTNLDDYDSSDEERITHPTKSYKYEYPSFPEQVKSYEKGQTDAEQLDTAADKELLSASSVESLLKLSSAPPKKEKAASTKASLTTQQLTLLNNYISGKQKIINDLELYYIKQLPCLCAYIISTLSVTAETKVRQHKKFEKAYGTDDVIYLMQIIQQCSVLTPLDIPNRASQIRRARDKIYQNNKPLDYYCELFNQFERDLVELDRPTPEEDLIVVFLDHLHPSYCSIIAQWKMNEIMPTTLDKVQHKLQQYESLALSQASNMKASNGNKGSEQGVQDVAMSLQSKKGKSDSKKQTSQQQKQQQPPKSQKTPLTEEEAKAKGIKKLSCCGKYGSHKPEDCRSLKSVGGTASSSTKSVHFAADTAAAVAAHQPTKGPSYYPDDFALVVGVSAEDDSEVTSDVTSSVDSPAAEAVTISPLINALHPSVDSSPVVTLYLDTGASSNAVPIDSPIVHHVHDIPSRDVIGVGQQECTKAGFLQHFGVALLIPSLYHWYPVTRVKVVNLT